MVDIKLLKKRIDESGMTMVAIAKQSGMLRETLYNRLNGVGEFTVSEVNGLTRALRLKKSDRDLIFFAKKLN